MSDLTDLREVMKWTHAVPAMPEGYLGLLCASILSRTNSPSIPGMNLRWIVRWETDFEDRFGIAIRYQEGDLILKHAVGTINNLMPDRATLEAMIYSLWDWFWRRWYFERFYPTNVNS